MNFDFKKELKKIIPKTLIERRRERIRQDVSSKLYIQNELNNPGDYYSLNAFDYYKCIFIHIPKAAGISVNKALFGNYVGSHRTINDYKKIYPQRTFESYYKFTFVRNPWDRIFSAYTFLKKGGMNKFDEEFMQKELNSITSFEEFINDWLNNESMFSYIHFKPQIHFIFDETGNCPVDFIGRYENLNHDFRIIANRINKNAKLQHLNHSSQKIKYNDIYTKEMIKKISILYEEDIEFLNYSCK